LSGYYAVLNSFPGVIEMRERALDQFAAPTHQTAAAWSTNPATIAIHRRLGLGHLLPVASTRPGSAMYERMSSYRR
jgi:hypothetical protein